MSFIAVAVGGSAAAGLAGAGIQAYSANKAADAQKDAAAQANALQERQFNQIRSDFSPYRKAGATALSQMANPDFQRDFTMSDYQADPGYEFRMKEAQKALERSAASRGGLQSGRTLKELTRYGQDYASNEYQNAYNRFNADRDRRYGRLSDLARMGQSSAAQSAAAGQSYANQAGQNIIGAGNAAAAGQIATGNAIAGGLSGAGNLGLQGANMYQQGKWMDQWLSNQGPQLTFGTPTITGG